MKAYSIDPVTQKVEAIDIEMKANTTYSFFNSILIDEFEAIDQHTVSSDSNALGNGEKAYFIGEQLVIGKALIIGRNGMEEHDAHIPQNELELIVNFEVPGFYQQVLALLRTAEINLYRTFVLEHNNEEIRINSEWVIYAFNMADEKTKAYFLDELQKVVDAKEDVNAYIQKMAKLALNATA